jgi:hypothetical protein
VNLSIIIFCKAWNAIAKRHTSSNVGLSLAFRPLFVDACQQSMESTRYSALLSSEKGAHNANLVWEKDISGFLYLSLLSGDQDLPSFFARYLDRCDEASCFWILEMFHSHYLSWLWDSKFMLWTGSLRDTWMARELADVCCANVLCDRSALQLVEGEACDACDSRGRWYPGRIVAVGFSDVTVHFLCWSAKFDETVTHDNVAKLLSHSAGSATVWSSLKLPQSVMISL